MKKFILITILAVLALSSVADAAMTYGAAYYRERISMVGDASSTDPLYLFINEVETTIDGTSGVTNIIFTPSTVPASTEGSVYYDSAANNLKLYNGSAWVDIDVAGASSLATAYAVGSAITVDTSAITLTTTDAANNVALAIAHAETGNYSAMTIASAAAYPALAFTTTGTGTDVTGTSATWNVTKAGVATFTGIDVGATDIVLENDEIINNVDDDVVELDGTEDFEIDLSGTNIIKFSSDTSAITLEFDTLDRFTGVEDITFDAEAGNITLTADAGTEDLTISQAGAVDASLILTSEGTGTDALSLITTNAAGDISLVSADNITRTAADNITDVTTDGGYTLTIGGATNGDLAVTAADEASIISVGALTLQNTEATSNITVNSVLGSIYIEAEEDAANAILITADGGVSSTLRLHNDTGTAATSIDLLSDVGGITATASAGPIVLTSTGATAGDMTFTVADAFTLTSTDTAQNGIHIEANGGAAESINLYANQGTGSSATTQHDASIQLQSDAGGISLYSTGNVADTIRLETNGGASETIVLSNVKGTGTSSILATSTVGGIKIAANAAGKDVDIDSVLGSILLEAEENSATAISIIADGGTSSGVWIQSETGTSVTEDTASVEIRSTVGGINIQSDANLDDAIMIRVDGGTTSEITIHNDQGNTADSIELVSDAGGITLNGAVGGVVFTAGQTRTEIFNITDVTVDSTVPPAAATLGTTAQDEYATLGFDANPDATGDDYVFIKWLVPAGYVANSAELHCYWSFSDAEDAADECVIDGTVNAIAATAGAGEATLGAGTAMAAVTSVITDASATPDTLIKTTLDIEVEDIAVGDLVSIAFFFDESACLMANSGTADVYYWTITYESTE